MRFKSISVISVSDTCRLINAELLYFFFPLSEQKYGGYMTGKWFVWGYMTGKWFFVVRRPRGSSCHRHTLSARRMWHNCKRRGDRASISASVKTILNFYKHD